MWDVTAFQRPITRDGDPEPRAGVSTRTLLGALVVARRFMRHKYIAYEYVEIARRR